MTCKDAGLRARNASIALGALKREQKDAALASIRSILWEKRLSIFNANQIDLERSEREGLASPLRKRLKLDEDKLREVCAGIDTLIRLPDPTGKVLSARELDTGLNLYQVTCPIGVIGVIFESRPDALVQISSLCLKSGNAALLKGGREALETNRVLFELISAATKASGVPEGWIALLETREEVNELLRLDSLVDLIVPRGSNEFVRHIMRNSSIPVLGHADGVCHLYVDDSADLGMALRLSIDAKTQYPAVCNAIETLLVHRALAPRFLPLLSKMFSHKKETSSSPTFEPPGFEFGGIHPVEIRGCPETQRIIPCKPATEEDWRAEYLDYILAVKVVGSAEEAVAHINTYGSRHTDGIVTSSPERARYFMERVDSANVFWNASTRFSDGYRYGLGAEVGIATGKLHARGPVGLEGLTTYKWRLYGQGHIVADYVGSRAKAFSHRPLSPELP